MLCNCAIATLTNFSFYLNIDDAPLHIPLLEDEVDMAMPSCCHSMSSIACSHTTR